MRPIGATDGLPLLFAESVGSEGGLQGRSRVVCARSPLSGCAETLGSHHPGRASRDRIRPHRVRSYCHVPAAAEGQGVDGCGALTRRIQRRLELRARWRTRSLPRPPARHSAIQTRTAGRARHQVAPEVGSQSLVVGCSRLSTSIQVRPWAEDSRCPYWGVRRQSPGAQRSNLLTTRYRHQLFVRESPSETCRLAELVPAVRRDSAGHERER